jgi:4-amino-4-deoxy-L-arabinose transferase-like glycosyltransferase
MAFPRARPVVHSDAMEQPASQNAVFRGWSFAKVLGVIVLFALVFRVTYVAGAKKGPCEVSKGKWIHTECAVGDQLFYNGEANRLAQGDGFVVWGIKGSHAPPAADHPPLTVVVLAPAAWLVIHGPFGWVHDLSGTTEERYYMALLGTLLVLLIGLLGRRIGGDRVGVIAALLAAIYPNLWMNDGLIMSETVTSIAVVLALWMAYNLRDRPRTATALGCGALCALCGLARAELGLFIPLLAVPAALSARGVGRRAHVRLAVTALAAAVVVMGPWVLYNESRFKDTTFVSTNDGLALAGSNCDHVYYGTAIGLTYLQPPCIDAKEPPGDQSQVSALYRKRAFEYIGNHQKQLPLVVLARIGRTWSLYRPLDMISFNEAEGKERFTSVAGIVTYYPFAALAIIGGWILTRRRRGMLWPLIVPAVALTVGVAITYGQTRFRSAAEPSIVLLAAVALTRVWDWRAGGEPSLTTERTE